jgi:Ca-activated chloride channel homolog
VGLAPPILAWSALFVLMVAAPVQADSARQVIQQGNQQYADGQYSEAINKYNEALVEQPVAIVPKFNKANSYYRLDDLGEAIDLYQEVAAESKDMALVSKAKYNLGNCFFQRGTKQRDSDLQKALEDMKTSITYWRGVLELDPENAKAARNIEVARLTIKDILDQLKKQQEQQEQQGEQNQDQQQQNQKQDQQQGQQQQDQSNSQEDPNQPQDPNQAQEADQKQDPNETEDQKQPDQKEGQQEQQAQQVAAPDTTAREILDKEQRQKEQRQVFQRGQTQKVDKDW